MLRNKKFYNFSRKFLQVGGTGGGRNFTGGGPCPPPGTAPVIKHTARTEIKIRGTSDSLTG